MVFYISDLDGTLLDNPKRLSQEYIDRLNMMIDEGLKLTIATGRDLKKTKKAIGGLHLNYPVILTNGALMADFNTDTYLDITTIENNIVSGIMAISKHLNIPPIVFALYDQKEDKIHFNKGKWGKKGIINLKPEIYENYGAMKVVSMQFHTTKKVLDQMKKEIAQEYEDKINLIYIEDVSYKHWGLAEKFYWLEINSIEAGKHNMIKKFAKEENIKLQDITFFGDNHNDLKSMKMVGYSVAIHDSPQELLDIANEIIGTNKEGSVITFIEKKFKKGN